MEDDPYRDQFPPYGNQNRNNRYGRPQPGRNIRPLQRQMAQPQRQRFQPQRDIPQPQWQRPQPPDNFNRNDLPWRNNNRAQTMDRHQGLGVNMQAQQGHRHPIRGMWRNRAHGSHQSLVDDLENEGPGPGPGFGQNNRDHRGQGRQNRNNRFVGFKALQDIAESDPLDILGKINMKKEGFFGLISQPVEADMHVLIVQILSKSCSTTFEELKLRLLLDVCNSGYLIFLTNYLMDLPYADDKRRNRFYWNNENDFWKHFIKICETIFNKAPSVAMQKCRSLIEMSSKLCLEELNKKHGFVLSKENAAKLDDLRERISIFEQKSEDDKKHRKFRGNANEEELEPPEDFRHLSVIPNRDELMDPRPYLRANVVRGGYRDVEHYLDVQFRLLREDCFGPLREGLLQYLSDQNKKKYDNMRVYRNIKFIGPYVSNDKIGVLIQLDENTQKRLKRINWAHSKRFIFGSLLLLSKDNCNSFITATILDRDIKYLAQGIIPVSIVENANMITDENIIENQDSFVMFESEVYFEPYLHVLKALQDPSFAEHIAMSKYIVNVEPTPRPPQYLNKDTIFEVETLQSPKTKFKVLNPLSWPSHKELALNDSQFEAFHLALTHEFAVIQGPPGTGKTYLGVKVARTLLENLITNGSKTNCLMLIICYTNHALDQFLEHIMDITESIVRIGGQSRNEAMEKISLNNLRRASTKRHYQANNLYMSEKRNLKIIMRKLQAVQKQIESLSNGILTYDCLCEYVPEVKEYFRGYAMRSGADKISTWLLENAHYEFDNNLQELLTDDSTDLEEIPIETGDDDTYERTAFILDDLQEINEIDINGIEVTTTFMLHDAEQKINRLVKHYKHLKHAKKREEKQFLEDEIRELLYITSLFKEMRKRHRERGVPRPVRDEDVLMRLPNNERWFIYFTWANTAINKIRDQIAPLQEELTNASATYEEARMNLDLNLLENIKVVGMTTSGAARLRKLLMALAPPIVIVEEAAEVLEQHIVTSLTRHCHHLILIGDHQQLRPSAAYMRLARHFDIEVSLFERMILNSMHSRRLRVQHRMRPEISALISPHIYPDLENHPSVEAFPRVRGVTANLYFYTHNYKEEEVDDSASRTNTKEADVVLALANYLMQQGYAPEDVTILAAYSGQMFYMRKQRSNYVFLDKVKITVVDNYQGEESKIILLSLVRNNTKNIIGFLGTENRICVALSRAKEGFYIFGNIDTLTVNSPLWTNIAKTLENSGQVGNTIRLKCENHPNQISSIGSLKDFEKVPEGGCRLMCNYNLPACSHPCPQICHGYDRGHANTKCQLNCERVICELGHVCPLKCAVKCQPCKVMIMKKLPCGHEMKVPCHREPTDPAVKCLTTVTVSLRDCGHEAKKPCHLEMKYVTCTVPCPTRVDRCGHTCRLRCHVTNDPDHEKYICEKACAQAKRGCTANLVGDRGDHQCMKQCHETCDDCNVEVVKKRSLCKHSERIACYKNVDETDCRKKCARVLPCGHFCKKKCFEKCGDCDQMVNKVIPECGHAINVSCKTEPTRELCQQACERRLACGHRCARRCAQPCSAALCTEPTPRPIASPCGHIVQLPCNVRPLFEATQTQRKQDELVLQHCNAACGAELRCGHRCAGRCAACRHGRLHAPCASACHVTNICGHQCEEPCNQICPPCKKRCEVRCPHSQCSKLCGAPCVPCQERCKRRCKHGMCTRRCGEPCSRPPCDEACDKQLPCRHPCRGLCGEPCPPICNVCSPDTFPRDFLGDEFDDDAKFIVLQDCSHILEVEDADNLMNGDKETISVRACPFCRKPIINTYRYKDRVNEMYRTQINPIKERVYGSQQQVKEKQLELLNAFSTLKDTHVKTIQANEHFKLAFDKLQAIVRTQTKISLVQLDMHFLYINIMNAIGDKINKYNLVKFTEFKSDFLKQVEIICDVLVTNIKKISQQQQEDINNEIRRMGSIIQLSRMFEHTAYAIAKSYPKVIEAATAAKEAVLSWKIYKENEVMAILKKFQEEIKVTGIVTKEERDLIVKAIGLKQGHWYQCPNGHFYCIGECGGAMQVGKCIECGVAIGGGSHRLLENNRHAPEMDGSRFAAWSQEYNNMANFNFDE